MERQNEVLPVFLLDNPFDKRSRNENNLVKIKIKTSNYVTKASTVTNSKTSLNFRLVHFNIRSLRNSAHWTQLQKFVIETQIEVIALSETWLNTTIPNIEINIEGYTLYRQDRLHKRGGGVVAYVRKDIKVTILKEISSVSTDLFHQLWLKLQHKKSRSIVMCVSYRPPDCPLSCFENNLKPSYTEALLLDKPIFILGDLNCNILKTGPESIALENFMYEMNLKQMITTPTRITDTCESLIDVILTSAPNLVLKSRVLDIIISDHLPIFTALRLKLPKPSPKFVLTRSYKNYDASKFIIHLASRAEELTSIFDIPNPNSKLEIFNSALQSTLDAHAPIKLIKIRERTCPFVTSEIKKQMKTRDHLHRRYQRTRNIDDWNKFKDAQRSIKSILTAAEREYVSTEISTNKDNPRSLWKLINKCIPSKDRPKLTYNNNHEMVAKEFNQYFQSVGKTTAEKATKLALDNNISISTELEHQPERTNRPVEDIFNFTPVSLNDVKESIMSMPSNKSPGPDKITIRIIKESLPVILGPLTDIINSTFHTSIFPESWKVAEILPLLKEGDHEIPANNRPLSMLNVLSKVCEKLALKQFSNFLNRTGRLSNHQSGNKKHHSTETLNIMISDFLLNAMDNKKLTALVLLDLSKAFDSIDHIIL